MPLVTSSFSPQGWISHGHVQTVLGALRRVDEVVPYRRERLELADGDFVDLDRIETGAGRVVVLAHGLEGSSADPYMRGMAAACVRSGWDVMAWNYRGCSGEPNRLIRAYHSGDTADLAVVIERAAAGGRGVAVVGFSLGGNVVLKYLGEGGVHPAVVAGVAVSAPVDLAASARALDGRWGNRVYLGRLIGSLVRKMRGRMAAFPGVVDEVMLQGVRGFAEFDGRFTAPLHGFQDAEDYWARSSARQFLGGIGVPALLINAADDPFLAPECFPMEEARASGWFTLEVPGSGGHLGFVERVGERGSWLERRVGEFLGAAAAGTLGDQAAVRAASIES